MQPFDVLEKATIAPAVTLLALMRPCLHVAGKLGYIHHAMTRSALSGPKGFNLPGTDLTIAILCLKSFWRLRNFPGRLMYGFHCLLQNLSYNCGGIIMVVAWSMYSLNVIAFPNRADRNNPSGFSVRAFAK